MSSGLARDVCSGSKTGSISACAACPFYPQEQTSSNRPLRSEKCQFRKSRALIEHLDS
jgi:hypothetical protein